MYGVEAPGDAPGSQDEDTDDIESSINKELGMLSSAGAEAAARPFTPIRTVLSCLFFVKTTTPIEPAGFVRRICEDAKACSSHRTWKTRYVNRLTPITMSGKATEKGIAETAKLVLAEWFDLQIDEDSQTGGGSAAEKRALRPAYSVRRQPMRTPAFSDPMSTD